MPFGVFFKKKLQCVNHAQLFYAMTQHILSDMEFYGSFKFSD